MKQISLKEYLATGTVSKEAVAQDEAIEIQAIAIGRSDPIRSILARLVAVEMLAKDLHYRAHGKTFYALHLLSDLIWEVRRERDELSEVYYLGERGGVPPRQLSIFSAACEMVKGDCNCSDCEDQIQIIEILRCHLSTIVDLVEQAKATGNPTSGVQAVLDEISKKSLQSVGLLNRTLSGEKRDPEAAD